MGSSIGDRLSSYGGGNSSDTIAKIRRVLVVIVVLVAVLFLVPSTVTYVNPGYVGIVIHRAGGGVDKTPLGPGLHFRNPLTTGIEEYPVFMRRCRTITRRWPPHRRRRRRTRVLCRVRPSVAARWCRV